MKQSLLLVFTGLFVTMLGAEPPPQLSTGRAHGANEVNRLQSFREKDPRGKRSFEKLQAVSRENQLRLEKAKESFVSGVHGQRASRRERSRVHVVSLENQNRLDEAQIAVEEEYLDTLAADLSQAAFVAEKREAIRTRREIMAKRAEAIVKLQTDVEDEE